MLSLFVFVDLEKPFALLDRLESRAVKTTWYNWFANKPDAGRYTTKSCDCNSHGFGGIKVLYADL